LVEKTPYNVKCTSHYIEKIAIHYAQYQKTIKYMIKIQKKDHFTCSRSAHDGQKKLLWNLLQMIKLFW